MIDNKANTERGTEKVNYNQRMMAKIAKDMANVSLSLQEGDNLFVEFHPGALQLKDFLCEIANEKGVKVCVQEYDPVKKAQELRALDPDEQYDFSSEVKTYKDRVVTWANKVAYLYAYEDPQAFQDVNPTILKLWNVTRGEIGKFVANNRSRVLTHLPTLAEANTENMDLQDYLKMFYEACNRNWGEVTEAQNILINEILDPGKQLEFYADLDTKTKEFKTHLVMSIKGMTFANSTIKANYPGSEVFSAPVAGTIEGALNLSYPIMFAGKRLPNLALTFKEGRVISHKVDGSTELEDYVASALDADEGARQVGECALGTNPSFYKPMLNPLFVEKVGGSFHIAVGASYKMTQYAGKNVNLNNGVDSNYHIDLTRMMTTEFGGGMVVVDGKIIQENGKFEDSRLAVLNTTH